MNFDAIAAFALSPPPVPPDARRIAATLLIDTLGVAAGAAGMEAGRIARDHAHRFMAGGAPGDAATLLFDGRSASIPGAAFAAATQIDNLDAHDGLNATKGHIGCAVVPALCAFAQALPQLTAPDALTALAMAYEIAARAALALHDTACDYHTSGAWNALGVAALGCHLRSADAGTLRHALGIAEYHGPRSQMMREIANPTMLHDGSGMGALTGAMAVLLAENGFEGAPAITVEAPEVAAHWADLGQNWTVTQNYIKPYPICRWAHAAIDALRLIVTEHALAPDDIAQIDVATFAESAALLAQMPATSSQAQYSLPFAMAAWLVNGHLGPDQITGAALADPRVAQILPRITVREDPRHSASFPAARRSDIAVTLRDGTRLTSGDVDARGGPEAPMPHHEIQEKFRIMTAALPAARAEALWQMRDRLDDPDLPFAGLLALIHPPPDRH